MGTAAARFDLTLEPSDKLVLSQAAALRGQTMASFVREAALSRARDLIEQESRITMSRGDFAIFTAALEGAFAPNTALKKALEVAQQVKRA